MTPQKLNKEQSQLPTQLLMGILATFVVVCVGVPDTAEAQDTGNSSVKVFGFLKTGYTAARGGVESYGRQNASAPTAASLPLLASDDGEWSSTFQVAQSRAGVHIDAADTVRTTLEVDFINFDRSSPTVQALPRLRIATIRWSFADNQSLTLGQTWDLFSPLNSVTTNFVGNQFSAGNAGFMRQQLIWRGKFGATEFGTAVGMPGANPTSDIGNLERGILPTVSALAGVEVVKGGRLGVTVIGTELLYGDADKERQSFGGNVWGEYKRSGWLVRLEGYGGQNMANLGLLTLGSGHLDADVKEVGGWMSVRRTIGEKHVLQVTLGGAQVLNTKDMLQGYSANGDGTFTRVKSQGLGIERNFAARAGYTMNFAPRTSFFVEPMWFSTQHRIAVSETRRTHGERQTVGLEVGAVYRF